MDWGQTSLLTHIADLLSITAGMIESCGYWGTELFSSEVFGKGNDFCKRITCKTTGEAPKALIAAFRNSYHPRIAVTVDSSRWPMRC